MAGKVFYSSVIRSSSFFIESMLLDHAVHKRAFVCLFSHGRSWRELDIACPSCKVD